MHNRVSARWVERFAAASFLAGCAGLLALAGDRAPLWIARLGQFGGLASLPSLRILAAVLMGFAVAALALGTWSRGLARFGGAIAAATGLATVSGALNGPSSTIIVASVVTVIGVALVAWLRPHVLRPLQTRVSDAWRIMGVIAVFCGTLGLAARMPMRERPQRALGVTHDPHDDLAPGAVDLGINTWEGMQILDTGIFAHLPQLETVLAAVPRGMVTYLVFYSPRCGMCHRLFEEHWSGHVNARVIAVKIPQSADDSLLPTDQPEEVNCPECLRMSLPAGPLWVVIPPTVVRIEDGVVSCANEPPARTNCIVH
ncbi:MAG: hypothetical protein SGJ09_11325 [Phycisphaerae bacterium]|nr:hypothetical protein [Phycisphaerae bacterium]